jgi:light-regulated signal transduction histidine kinase (bacteriophytochrome)
MVSAFNSSASPSQPDNLLQRITKRIRRSLELQEILDATVVELRSFLKIDRVKVYRFYPDAHGEVIAESLQAGTLPSLWGLHFPATDVPASVRDILMRDQQRVIVNVELQQIRYDRSDQTLSEVDLEPEESAWRSVDPCHAQYLTAMGVHASLVFPILTQQGLWGLLVAHHHAPHDFSSADLHVAQFVVDQVSIAIAQATLLAEARRQAYQEATINQLSLVLHRLPEIDLQTGLEQAIAALKGAGGRLYRVAKTAPDCVLYHQGEQPHLPPTVPNLVIEQHILWLEYFRPASRDRLQPAVYALKDLYAEPRLRALAPAFQTTAIRGLLVVPLQHRQEFLGYLTLFRHATQTETVWAGEFSPDQRQDHPRASFAAWKDAQSQQAVAWTEDDVALALALASQFAIAMYEYDLFQQVQQENQFRQQVELTLRRQAEEDRLRVAILQRIRQSLNLNTILDTTVAEVRQFLQTDRVLIYQFEPDWNGKVVAESVSFHELSILGQMIYDPCFAEQELYKPYQQGRTSQITDLYQLNLLPCYFEMLTSLKVVANLVVPILMQRRDEAEVGVYGLPAAEPQLWGLLIAHHCDAPREWQSWEVNFLQQLAVQVAIALNQAELYEQVQHLNLDLEQQVQARTAELQRALEYEALLKRITDQVRDSLDEKQILQTAVEALGKGLSVVCCDAAVYNLDDYITTVCFEYLKADLPGAIGLSANMKDRIELYDQLLAGQHFQFCLLPTVLSSIRQVGSDYGILACPMKDDQGVLGDLWLLKPQQECFGEQEIRLVQQVANQCAIALRQARLYQAAQLQVEELARLNQLKDDFLSTVSHELRTPISSIKLATQMLEMLFKGSGIPDLDGHQATQYFEILDAECHREITLIDDLLSLTRLDAASEPLSLTTIALPLWIPHVAEGMAVRMATQHQRLEFELPTHLPPITTDLSYLERILSELLNNACKYTPAHQMVTIACDYQDDLFQLRVSNTGVEIAATERDRIFDKFYRIPNNDPWKHGGTGLGLALVKKLTEYLSGSIQVETQPNQTTFVVKLPNLREPRN